MDFVVVDIELSFSHRAATQRSFVSVPLVLPSALEVCKATIVAGLTQG
jgi:hypothetical protein